MFDQRISNIITQLWMSSSLKAMGKCVKAIAYSVQTYGAVSVSSHAPLHRSHQSNIFTVFNVSLHCIFFTPNSYNLYFLSLLSK